MKSFFIAGNWKSNKTTFEASEWLKNFKSQISNFKLENIQLVLCVPFTTLTILKKEIAAYSLPIQLGVQNVSPFPDGAYTGEVSARMVKELAEWVIIGHSERRKYFGETSEMLKLKVEQARSVGLKIIYCVESETTIVPGGVDVVAYEPVWAIGTGKAETPENANQIMAALKEKTKLATVIYGGSVTPENVASFVREPAIDGVLPGGASLDPEKFWQLIKAAQYAS